ncbi:MAG: sulfurtransferase TusA family protein [Planctomycetota bacterium]|nr:sulfurtransferase TusA family protein [Planctomycetota bacterium]
MREERLDCRGLACPMPIVRISQAMKTLAAEAILTVEADDPAFPADIRAWAQMTGHELIELDEGDVIRAKVRRRG